MFLRLTGRVRGPTHRGRGFHLRARLVGLLLFAVGVAVIVIQYAFWRSGFDSPVRPPVPEPIPASWSFAFNPLVCAMPIIALGAFGLMVEGLRRVIDPSEA